MFSKTSGYAIRAAIYLASKITSESNVSLFEIAKELDAPSPYIGKILQTLAKKKLITSTKGPNGGFKANETTNKITVYQLLEAIGEDKIFDTCAIGIKECSNLNPCPIHHEIVKERTIIKERLSQNTIGQLAKKYLRDENCIIN